MKEDLDIDPSDFDFSSDFKKAVYDEVIGVPTWMQDLKLEIIWRQANDKEVEPYMEEVVN